MVINFNRKFNVDREKFQRLARPTNYTIIAIVLSAYFLMNLKNTSLECGNMTNYALSYETIIYGSIFLTILISISYYLGYYYPENSIKRGIYLLLASIFILLDACLWALTAIINIEIDGVGSIIIDTTHLYIAPIYLFTGQIFKKIYDLLDFIKNKDEYLKEQSV